MDTRTATAPTSSRRDAPDIPQEQLVLVLDRARPLQAGARHTLANLECVTIGRGRARAAERVLVDGHPTLRLLVPDQRVSALHVRLERSDAGWRLTDCDSTNGTQVNRRSVTAATLSDGDVVDVGQTFFRYRAAVPTPIGAPGDADAASLQGIQKTMATLLPWFARDLQTLARMAKTDVAILLIGQTGTGKEVLARAIHEESGRAGPFVAINCGAMPATLVESLLFGYRRGAFSGALKDEPGLARAAHGGTLFLDEIGDASPSAQVAMLRLLQEREVLPLGATRPVPIDVRIIAATHRPLEGLAQSGEFRQDLLARVAGFVHVLPTLRERIDDFGLLLAALLRKLAPADAPPVTLSANASHTLLEYSWPLNVRELEHRLKAAIALAPDGRVELSHVWKDNPPETGASEDVAARSLTAEDQALRAQLVEHLSALRGNVTRVGEAMGKSRTQVQRWVRRLRIDAERFRR